MRILVLFLFVICFVFFVNGQAPTITPCMIIENAPNRTQKLVGAYGQVVFFFPQELFSENQLAHCLSVNMVAMYGKSLFRNPRLQSIALPGEEMLILTVELEKIVKAKFYYRLIASSCVYYDKNEHGQALWQTKELAHKSVVCLGWDKKIGAYVKK